LPLCLLNPVGCACKPCCAACCSAPANQTVTAALRALGLADEPGFQNYHRLLNRARWSARQAAHHLLKLLVEAFVPAGPVIIGLDDTVERRRGRQLTARAIYYDAARSSKACFQKTSGLRWMNLALLVPVSWAARVWALPFLTALCPSERYAPYVRRGRRHKPLVERARGLIGQVRRWLPDRMLVVVADSSYAALEFLAWCARQARPVTVISRLRLDAALYAPAPARRPGRNGRPRLKGQRLPSLAQQLEHARTRWQACRLCWYGDQIRRLQLATGTAVWYSSGKPSVSLRWVLVRDPKRRSEPQALLSTDLTLSARQIVLYFVRRWSMETTFQEARLYLGVEGQRQWNDLAIARATPVRLGLFSLVALIVQRQPSWQGAFRRSAWYEKARPTFADALAQVRRALWRQLGFWLSVAGVEKQKPAHLLFEHFAELLAYAA
jgi:hypothetical protein